MTTPADARAEGGTAEDRANEISDALRARLADIDALESTVDLIKRDEYTRAAGWNIDAREIALPQEEPGAPASDGSFAAAVAILKAYTFTPQRLIRGAFDPNAPLEQRPMLLRARFLWMRFELGVKVNRVIDDEREREGIRERVWGYSYHTLKGHMERGEITFEVVKRASSGDVVFRIHSFSQTAHIANWFHRLGFRVVGRRLQRYFAEQSLVNMQRMVVARLSGHA